MSNKEMDVFEEYRLQTKNMKETAGEFSPD